LKLNKNITQEADGIGEKEDGNEGQGHCDVTEITEWNTYQVK
jgi:hypothetical protein